jgi:DNA-binding transcriptional LysR family regulator
VSGEYSTPRGELIVAASMVFGRVHVLPVVGEFLKAYPEVDIRLVLSDRSISLVEDSVDLAVRIGELPDSSLIATRIGTIRRVVCASPAYLAEHGEPQSPMELGRHRCVTFEGLRSLDSWSFRVNGAELSVPIRSRLLVNAANAVIDAAIAGIGVARLLSYQVENAKQAGLLTLLLQDFEPAPMPVSLIYPRQGRLPLKLRAFLDFAAPRLRARLDRLGRL